MSAIYEASESGRQHKSCWHSSISLRGLDVRPHQYSSALSNHLNAWSLSFMKMLKYAVHHGDSTWFSVSFSPSHVSVTIKFYARTPKLLFFANSAT